MQDAILLQPSYLGSAKGLALLTVERASWF
jgi:hypothetical protein